MTGSRTSAASGAEPESPTVGRTTTRPAEVGDWAAIWQIIKVVISAGDTFTYPINLKENDARSLWMVSGGGQTIVAID